MKATVLAALALVCACVARADTVTVLGTEFVLPAASQVTSSGSIDVGYAEPYVDFSFADGTGSILGDQNFGDGFFGGITFSVPVSHLTVNWESDGVEDVSEANSYVFTLDGVTFGTDCLNGCSFKGTSSSSGDFGFPDCSSLSDHCTDVSGLFHGTYTFTDSNIRGLSWSVPVSSIFDFAGITSLSFTVPEPETLLLLTPAFLILATRRRDFRT